MIPYSLCGRAGCSGYLCAECIKLRHAPKPEVAVTPDFAESMEDQERRMGMMDRLDLALGQGRPGYVKHQQELDRTIDRELAKKDREL